MLFGVATPQGVIPATIAQGDGTTGKVYFDVTGDAPDAVVYTAGTKDLLAWEQPVSTPRQAWTQSRHACDARHARGSGHNGDHGSTRADCLTRS